MERGKIRVNDWLFNIRISAFDSAIGLHDSDQGITGLSQRILFCALVSLTICI